MEKEIQETIDKLCKQIEEQMKQISEQDISASNIEYLSKLVDIKKDIKEMEESNMYGNYGRYGEYSGRGPSRGSYGEYGRGGYGEGYGYSAGSYGRRGRDSRYRGDESIERMSGEYGRYMENRERYGASQETDKSFHYMVEAWKDFGKVIKEEAETPEQRQMLQEAVQTMM